ncbi:MAG TPA: FAD-dependent oxidoreductase [Steroidobacteraceae bacterium]
MQDLIVFSHLRWDFVYQRPQHLMSRLANYYRVFFFEEPEQAEGVARLNCSMPVPNVWVCRPGTPLDTRGFHDSQLPSLQTLVDDMLAQFDIQDPIVWFYTPMALPLLQRLKPKAIIYDCMDELSAFLNAPRQLLQRESALLKAADAVFTGGRSLYRAKQPRHPHVHCFPSSVEREHFARARDPKLEHPDQVGIAYPKLGFFGVIDERVDVALLSALADAHPEWQIIIVGPVVKIDRNTLPKRENIHYMGQRSYAELPQFLAGWDLCLLPFALNEATRYISPTKTLEYMAADKMIVSTPVTDVAETFGGIIECATGEEFIRACERALALPAAERDNRIAAMRAAVEKTSWDSTALQMHEIIQGLEGGAVGDSGRALLSQPQAPQRESTIVIGAGPTGLSAAYHLGEDCLLLEQQATVGGWCRSIQDKGFTFDYAGHIMFSNDPYVLQMYRVLLKDNVHWQNREAWIYSNNVHTRYPFQGALYGLPADVLKDCLIGAIEARFGALKSSLAAPAATAPGVTTPGIATPGTLSPGTHPPGTPSAGSAPSACKAESITDCCADGVVDFSSAKASHEAKNTARAPRNFEEFIYTVWGRGVAEHFAIPYNSKLWAVPLSEMETSWLGGRVPLPDLEEMIDGALRPVGRPMGPNARFGYPLRGGFQALMNGFLDRIEGKLKVNAQVVRIDPHEHELDLSDGTTYRYDHLISTMPLPLLVKTLGDHAPPAVRDAASRLRHVSVRCVNLGIGRENITDKHWIYYPGKSVFHRIFVQGNASPHCNAPGGFALTCEITYSPHKPLPCEGDDLIDRCIEDCINVGIIRDDDPIVARNQVDMPYAYVVYDHGRARNVELIRNWLRTHSIELAGRYSEWEYYNSDHAFLAGRKAAKNIQRQDLERASDRALEVERG